MSRRLGIVIALAGVTASAFAWGWYSDDALDRERHASAPTTATDDTLTTSTNPQRSRVFSTKNPLLATPHLEDSTPVQPTVVAGRWTTVTTPHKNEPVAPKRTAAPVSSKSLTSLKPGDPDARAQLVRDIQYELKRVGCYGGEVHGTWTSGTKQAMKLFTDRVNASLPLEEPDYVLLTLVQNGRAGTCGKGCPEGQLVSEDGRCLPRAIVAQQRSRKGIASIQTEQDLTITGSHHSASAPLPGRMAIGAPAAGASQEVVLEEARRTGAATRLGMPAEEGVVPRSVPAAPGSVGPEVQAGADSTQPRARRNASAKRSRPNAQPGSTRQVFSNLMRNAP
jgi:peptidoglycan hydrolase-like protein with peptidoglycan-binding domain